MDVARVAKDITSERGQESLLRQLLIECHSIPDGENGYGNDRFLFLSEGIFTNKLLSLSSGKWTVGVLWGFFKTLDTSLQAETSDIFKSKNKQLESDLVEMSEYVAALEASNSELG